ncbi:hypothetical protein BS47DRAFT_1391855 [Hydnum rufescens UP504]|uniref:WW domain-containing protein n=1 Tax=Hydnum rufescens UP504 TaxID=1448309 RepID=A0A9P6B2H2_9AGAM|nr:hypothetical protein BS47DRAFT_1391855 [Hydnum rufescens UP504]
MPFEDDDHESLDWGDDPRLEDDDPTQAPVIGKPAPPHSSTLGISPPPSRAHTLNESPSARAGPTMSQTTPKNNASFSSILSKTSSGSNSAAHPTNSSGLSAASHPSLPPKPSEAITLAAEAAISRDFRKRERDQILAPGIASMAPRKPTQTVHDIVDLPPDWEIRTSRSSNETYYFNIRTSETTWARPLAVRTRDLRSITPPRRVDERDRERIRDNTKDSAERNVTKDRGRERARERERSRSRSLSRDRHRFRETEIARSRAPGWDRYRPEEHSTDAKGRSSEKDRPPKLVPTLPAKAVASLPPRPTSTFENKSTDPPRRASSRDRGRDSELKRIPVSKDVDRDSRHWSPARDTVAPEPIAMSPKRGRRDDQRDVGRNLNRDEEHRPVRNITRDASPPPRIPVSTVIRPVASRQATSNQSKSHSPGDPEHHLNSRASLSPPRVLPPRRSPSPDHQTSRRASQSPIPISTLNNHSHRPPFLFAFTPLGSLALGLLPPSLPRFLSTPSPYSLPSVVTVHET